MKDISKLPKWAQEYIKTLQIQRNVAVDRLRKYVDSETESKIWTEDLVCTDIPPEHTKNFFQCEDINIEHAGVRLHVNIHDGSCIKLSWVPAGPGAPIADIAFVPTSYQQARLKNVVYDEHELDRLLFAKERDECEK